MKNSTRRRTRQAHSSALLPNSVAPPRAVRSHVHVVERGFVVALAGTLAEVRALLTGGA
jgi:hypothetical protein